MRSLMWSTLFVSFCCLYRLGVLAHPAAENVADCAVAIQQFRSVGLYDTPQQIIQGTNLKVCQSRQTCCDPATETRLMDMVDEEYKRHLAAHAGYVNDLLSSTAHHLQDHMTQMIRKSKSKTIRVLADVYVTIAGPATDPLDMFHDRLSRYVHEDPETVPGASLEEAVSKLFTDLFPVVYRTVAVASEKQDKAAQFDEDYVQCLTGKALDVKPFGEVPTTLAKDISRTFTATNVLVHALRYGSQLVNEEHAKSWLGYGNRDQCIAALTKMRQCSWCAAKEAKPCHGLCINVVRGCLARETAHLDAPWTGFYEAIDRLVSAINNGQSSVCLEDLLRSLHSRISEAIMYAMDHASEIQNNVKFFCGLPKWNDQVKDMLPESIKTPESQEVWNGDEEDKSSAHLTDKLTKFSDPEIAVRVRGLFANMAQSVCSNYSSTNCWNGQTVGEYTDNVVGPLLSAQMYNPEFDWTSSINTQDNKVAEVIDKLRHVRQMVLNQVISSPQSDSYMADEAEGSGEGSGSGPGRVGWGDDDDAEEYASGEGSGDNPLTTPEPDDDLESTRRLLPKTKILKDNSGSSYDINTDDGTKGKGGATPSLQASTTLVFIVTLFYTSSYILLPVTRIL
ncbi:division abnormally delayed protein [Daktulosphaira vitifoliae]|uniref:division abnormally delayed protein n=1 Tax=Daktulosphaira vitifoliae TaxID=58002 RepID=UPI0021AA0B2D|nr:division abnormally delayed protein [Daktulosphaira vitifoliae]